MTSTDQDQVPYRARSMTGFASSEGEVGPKRVRVEIRSLNHRFLDIKTRIPKEFSLVDLSLRSETQKHFARGSIEIKVEKLSDANDHAAEFEANLALAAHYFECLKKLQLTLGLADTIRTSDILTFPDVIARSKSYLLSPDAQIETKQIWTALQPVVRDALRRLAKMREEEGKSLQNALEKTLRDLRGFLTQIQKRRSECLAAYKGKVQTRLATLWDSFKIEDKALSSLVDTRVAQELALLLDRTDIEEEIARFDGHLEHFQRVLSGSEPMGRKLEFLCQELHREANTMGNKAQDLSMNEVIVQVKVLIEQLREQVLNLE